MGESGGLAWAWLADWPDGGVGEGGEAGCVLQTPHPARLGQGRPAPGERNDLFEKGAQQKAPEGSRGHQRKESQGRSH